MLVMVTKDDYTNALLAYQKFVDEIRSDDRDKAAASVDIYMMNSEDKGGMF